MKRWILMPLLGLAALGLTACGGQRDAAVTSVPTIQASEAVESTPEAVESTPEAVVVEVTEAPATLEESGDGIEQGDGGIDLDLSEMSGTVVYAQVYDMMAEPEAYLGSRVRVKGRLSYYRDEESGKEYFAAVIADATACCAQGIEFVWAGTHRYPDDYPPLDTEVTVTGVFDTYDEDGITFVQLKDAGVTWG